MTTESRWYAAVVDNDGRPPEVLQFAEAELTNPRLALELALAILEGQAGSRSTAEDDGTTVWYWPRPGGDWWSVPSTLNLAAHALMQEAIHESCRRNAGISRRAEVRELLRSRL